MDTPVIEISQVSFSYNGATILEEVNLDVQSGDFLAIIGPNGGGKTTLIKLMLGLLKPDRGHLRVLGLPPHEASPRVGYVPQDTGTNVSIPITVFNVVLMGCLQGGGSWRRYSSRDRQATREVLERVGMWEFRRRRMNELSGGQRQRVLVARALVSNPVLLLLDEPTASIDTDGQTLFYNILKELNKTITIVAVSHDLMVISSYVKSVACVSGQVYFHDKPEITKDMLEQAYHCPVELIAHGMPHRVLDMHGDD